MTVPEGAQANSAFDGPQIPQTHPPPGFPTSYLQLSDLRISSKRKRASSPLSSQPCPQSDRDTGHQVALGVEHCVVESTAGAPQDVCVDCVVNCDDADCPVSSEEQCTDQCIVVPCNDKNTCSDVCIEDTCQVERCDGGDECTGTLDESLQLLCCTDYHGYYAPPPSQINWDCPLDEILGVTGSQSNFLGHSQFSEFIPQIDSISSSITMSGMPYDTSSLPSAFQENSTTGSLLATPNQTCLSPATSQSHTQAIPPNDFQCRWIGCDASFNSLNELVGHVNLTHLRAPSSPPRPVKRLCLDSAAPDVFPLSCQWDDCHIYPDASMLPGPSTGLQPEMAFDFLSSHFIHDHLGLSVPPPQAPPIFHDAGYSSSELREKTKLSLPHNTISGKPEQPTQIHLTASQPSDSSSENTKTLQMVEPSYATPEASPSPVTTSLEASHSHDCATSAHVCHWESCGASFDTCAALTDHLASAHVGSGKGRYDCHWGDCARSGAHGFASKQKIMRHLQAHTGHRPFTCAECGQHFSEAATLQQHMRRHTQEKPFVCNFPGCGKAFAITGALTIHKRTHNGERPFQCPHCDRAFAESSNLSKHLRTHTGDRPYRCTEPGCGKAFARPDQLHRHGNVHTKKKAVGVVSAGSILVQ